jgi:hypothetical protein
MPNHVHVLLYFPVMPKSLSIVIGNGKRFMSYEIIKRLEADKNILLLQELYDNLKKGERKRDKDIKYLRIVLM